MHRTWIAIAVAACLVLSIASCTAGANPTANVPDANGNIAGFWLGIWHGLIAPVTFVLSLFMDNVHCYEVHNTGWPYNLGFLLGLGCLGGGSGAGAKCGTKKRRAE